MAGSKRKLSNDDDSLTNASTHRDITLPPVPGASDSPSRRDQHFRQLYRESPDFQHLARLDADFAAVLDGGGGRDINFLDPKAVMQLTKTLLKLDFALDVELPDDRLCPPVTNRHNYILWIKDLLDSTGDVEDSAVSHRKAVGIDVGTGASCIYPLLGCAQRPWSFIATDIDSKNLQHAQANINRNHLSSRIHLLHRSPEQPLLPLLDDDNSSLPSSVDFTMTNPPFYASTDSMVSVARAKSRPAFTACTGSETEMVYPGGEVAFVERILQESLRLREKVTWYTSMLGFLSSVATVVEKLKGYGIENYAVTEFVQGSKTKRWAVGWSFGRKRPDGKTARGVASASSSGVPKSMLPAATEVEVGKVDVSETGSVVERIKRAMEALDLTQWHWDAQRSQGSGQAADRVWARAWRRKKKRGEVETVDMGSRHPFVFKVAVKAGREQAVVTCRWVEGDDAVTFESFQGYVKGLLQPG